MSKLDDALKRYEDKFKDRFPMIVFRSSSEERMIEIMEECITKNKSLYDLGYLTLDPNVYY